jgi:N-carbamoylputrescine amidase
MLRSGCYVISSNRAAGAEGSGKQFGGRGFVFSPLGELMAETSPDQPLLTVEVDVGLVEQVQSQYPCNVKELSVQR